MLSAHAPFAMRERGATGAEYLAAHDPMQDRHGVAVPTLPNSNPNLNPNLNPDPNPHSRTYRP